VAKLRDITEEQVKLYRQEFITGKSFREIASEYGLAHMTLFDALDIRNNPLTETEAETRRNGIRQRREAKRRKFRTAQQIQDTLKSIRELPKGSKALALKTVLEECLSELETQTEEVESEAET
jgi:predicted DNA-binding protein YlxM (UPF0122 family)